MADNIPQPAHSLSSVRDAFRPVLYTTVTPYVSTEEQERSLQEILALSSSDSRFAQKAFAAIKLLLAGGVAPPIVSGLSPATGASGTLNLKVTVFGTGFDTSSVIYVDGNGLRTTYVSATEINASVNLTQAKTVQVNVLNSSGIVSNSKPFVIT